MKSPPCEKCLKLAICIRKELVHCTDLAIYAHSMTQYGEVKMWRLVEKSLPNAIRIYSNRESELHHPWYRK